VAVEGATYYYYDRGNPVLECSSDGTVTAVNVFSDDGLVSRKQAGSWRYYQFDPQGSVAHRINASESFVASAKHDAYGQAMNVPGPSQGGDPYGYNGRWGYYMDSETGLHYCQQRYYDAAAGRWLTRDPIGYAGGMNPYGYCGGAPVGNVDPDGRRKVSFIDPVWEWYHNGIGETERTIIRTWDWALDNLGGWAGGRDAGQTIVHPPGSVGSEGLRDSRGGGSVTDALPTIAAEGTVVKGSVSTKQAFLNTVSEPANGVQAFTGAFTWSATRVGGCWIVTAQNTTGTNSFFYHGPGLLGIPDKQGGWMGSTKQEFVWVVP
jgi:RHS repeat-associated protein